MGKKDSHLTKVEPKDILDEQYIADYLESHAKISTWNRTQLYLIVESITSAINTIAEAYYYYPGSALYLLRLLKTNNSTQGKNDALKEHLIQYSYAMAHVDDAHELFEISKTSSILYQIGVNHLHRLKLRPLQGNTAISTNQFNEARQILDYFLQQAMDLLKKAPHYKKAKQDSHLYYPEPPIIIDGKRINPPFPKEHDTQENKKRKRTSSQHADQAFFNAHKKVKRSRQKQNHFSTNRNNIARTKV